MPLVLNAPTFSICAPTLLDMGTEEQKRQHLPAVIRGDEIMVQFLSEPRGGSDLAGVTTRATRDGDMFILNGSKIWSSDACAADWALCLARTDWDAPKHRGLTMFLVKVHQPGIDIQRIKQVNGSNEFCQEFFDDVPVPAANVVGEVNGGWAVASRQLFHERNAVGGGSPYVSGGTGRPRRGPGIGALIDMVRDSGRSDDPRVRELVAEAHAIGARPAAAHRPDHGRDAHRAAAAPGDRHHPAVQRGERQQAGRDRRGGHRAGRRWPARTSTSARPS